MTRGGGVVQNTPKIDDIISEQPLTICLTFVYKNNHAVAGSNQISINEPVYMHEIKKNKLNTYFS